MPTFFDQKKKKTNRNSDECVKALPESVITLLNRPTYSLSNGDISLYIFLKDQSVLLHCLLAKDYGQEFIVGYVLDHGRYDPSSFLQYIYFLKDQIVKYSGFEWTRYLVKSFIVPVRIDAKKFHGNSIVFPHKNGVLGSQQHLLVDADITCTDQSRASPSLMANSE